MTQFLATAATAEPHTDAANDAFDRLTWLGWRWGLAAIVGGLAASFFLFGYALIYWRNADMDFMVIYNALVLNDGKQQLFFDHTAYLTILSVKFWFQLLHALGLLDAYSLATMPSAANTAAFDAGMTGAVRAGRVLAWLTATGCVLIFAGLVRHVVGGWRVAMFATLAFAFSGGVAVHSRILRSELVAACPVIFALMILIAAGCRARPARAVPFGSDASASIACWRNTRSAWVATGIAAIAAIAAAWAAWPLIATGFDRGLLDAVQFHPLLLRRCGVYQAALLFLIAACMMAYAAIWRVSAAETLSSMFAIAAGASIALLALDLVYNPGNVIAVINPLEKMLTFADAGTSDIANGAGLSGTLPP